MTSLGLTRYAITIGASAALLAGCGALRQAQDDTPPIGAPRALPQRHPVTQRADRGESWMLPQGKSDDLVYVSEVKKLVVYAYPSGTLVGKLTGFAYAGGLCSDASGDIWVTDSQSSKIVEYAHGGTSPIATLSTKSEPLGCAVDRVSGDLAVAELADVAIYRSATGYPAIYSAKDFSYMTFCTYDGSGNLFISAWRNRGNRGVVKGFLKLAYGGSILQRLRIKGARRGFENPGPLQWDGGHLLVGYAGLQDTELYEIVNSGLIGTVIGTVKLAMPGEYGRILAFSQLWLHKGRIVVPYETRFPHRRYVGFWSYPGGGEPMKSVMVRGRFSPIGVTVSVAPAR